MRSLHIPINYHTKNQFYGESRLPLEKNLMAPFVKLSRPSITPPISEANNQHTGGTLSGEKCTPYNGTVVKLAGVAVFSSPHLVVLLSPPLSSKTMTNVGNSEPSSNYAVNVRCIQVILVCHHLSSQLFGKILI